MKESSSADTRLLELAAYGSVGNFEEAMATLRCEVLDVEREAGLQGPKPLEGNRCGESKLGNKEARVEGESYGEGGTQSGDGRGYRVALGLEIGGLVGGRSQSEKGKTDSGEEENEFGSEWNGKEEGDRNEKEENERGGSVERGEAVW